MRKLLALFGAVLFSSVTMFGQGASGTVQVGYAVVTPSSPISSGLVVLETIIQTRGQDVLEVGVFPPALTTSVLIPVEISSARAENLGIAIANPNNAPANLI